jgi:hypothetical protein
MAKHEYTEEAAKEIVEQVESKAMSEIISEQSALKKNSLQRKEILFKDIILTSLILVSRK